MTSEKDSDSKPQGFSWRFVIAWAAALLCVFCTSAGLVMARQIRLGRQTGELEQTVARGAHVLVMQLSDGSPSRTIDLPASVHGYIETPVYAKIPGYMKAIYVDKGDRVKEGQVLAILSSPETDRQVEYAKADLHIKTLTNRRFQDMVKYDAASQQQADQTQADMLQAQATLRQLKATQQYEEIRADFDGIVTARYVDPGTLIPQSTAPSSTANSPIVALATMAPLRIYAYVPQSLSPFIKDGDPADIAVTEFPNRNYSGTVTRHPDALDQTTRTMLVEVDLPNQDRSLYPGMYADMKMTARVTSSSLAVPDDALVFRDDKIYLPVVRDNHLKLVDVTLGHDNGYTVEVSGDLREGEQIAVNVGQAARDGEPVQPVESNPSKS